MNAFQRLFSNQKRGINATKANRIGISDYSLLTVVVVLLTSVLVWHKAFGFPLQIYIGMSSGRQVTPQSVQLKHIFHQNTRDFNANLHGRLDINNDFIKVSGLGSQRVENCYEKAWAMRFKDQSPWTAPLPIKSTIIKMQRINEADPDFIDSYIEQARTNPSSVDQIPLEWSDTLVNAPNVTDKETLITLALMSSNAYVEVPETGDWRDVRYNYSYGHGWNGTGVRGHIFVTDDNDTVVIAYKGTSAAYLTGSGSDDTVVEDKDNDNLLFSCCCARVGYMWTPVCDCYRSSYTCDQTCLEKELYRKDKYYMAALNVFRHVRELYPDSTVWLTGHSLGGALASLVGRTYGVPAVSFEAPGELLATRRLHLPIPPGLPGYLEGIWHFGHTADPIFMGVCNGASSSCSVAGYAMETQCHSGKQCVYDVVTDKGWHVNMLNHRIHTVIDDVIEAYNDTAKCTDSPPCRDCFNWNFVSNREGFRDENPEASTSSSISRTPEPTKEPKCVKWTWYGRCIKYSDEVESDLNPSKCDKDSEHHEGTLAHSLHSLEWSV